jgi:hypothetical protein
MKIGTLILFDTPLIIGDNFPSDKNTHLSNMKGNSLGTIENLDLKIISLECYGRERNLNILKTLEILVELIKCENFNKNITFEYSALSNIMTFLAYKVYIKNLDLYNDPNDIEKGEDKSKTKDEKNIQGIDEDEIYEKNPKYLPKQMFFGYKSIRDYLYYQSFDLKEYLQNSKITLKNVTIRKQIENFENQDYLMKKKDLDNKKEIKNVGNRQLRKIDFGSDGFYIDRDYKNFFSINEIKCVELVNVNFSNVKIPDLKNYEGETIINLINNSKSEKENIKENNYGEFHFPNYSIDMKTLNGILFKNYGFEDFCSMFKYYLYRIEPQIKSESVREVNNDEFEKKKAIKEYFNKYQDIFNKFISNVGVLTVIINNLKELKEFYLVYSFLEIFEKKYFINETLKCSNKEETFELPDKNKTEEIFGNFFYKEKNELENEMYSEINYYYISEREKELMEQKEKYVEVNDKKIYYDLKFEKISIK